MSMSAVQFVFICCRVIRLLLLLLHQVAVVCIEEWICGRKRGWCVLRCWLTVVELFVSQAALFAQINFQIRCEAPLNVTCERIEPT